MATPFLSARKNPPHSGFGTGATNSVRLARHAHVGVVEGGGVVHPIARHQNHVVVFPEFPKVHYQLERCPLSWWSHHSGHDARLCEG